MVTEESTYIVELGPMVMKIYTWLEIPCRYSVHNMNR